ncbi:hypothetical protein FHX82_006077 [Amycolatopsis bartoniae]|uniref:Ricin B lectin domain-containing protein n=1 Tax=Amycolatopsis bartoniae TaxID=941986 RepID=A0A8H9MDT6_9PSEU|nr:ricin-type beta-trefoil lectin domain protein [Amycolatopsis bartoniae]MBB2938991.1 hypothetical protein [Amycolatopsis bartoniae]TVT04247.1 ricin-type beta-trefoil lectin domain protein [Amycolatopsis bartoniae]GHF65725.1 hypothetical protein GCM10017566_44160 [Amycolatopsis bartoniae]
MRRKLALLLAAALITVTSALTGAGVASATTETLSSPSNMEVSATSLCWDIGSNSPGTTVVLASCHYADDYTSQKWYRTTNYTTFNIVNYNNLCMDLPSNNVGAHVVLAPCHYEDTYTSQKWHRTGQGGGIIENGNGLCIDVSAFRAGTPVGMNYCAYSADYTSQQWHGTW